jgi:aerobic-type carbon monoxide dehydrogenase small subunit (CoxS/CutS family)
MKKRLIELRINNDSYDLAVEPQRTLLEVLREDLGLTGAKEACGTGECGACTVLIDGKPILSCLTLAIEVQGKEIITIEGLTGGGDLHPLQKAFIQYGAIQCGYCTSGMILNAKSILDENPKPSREEILKGLEGNLCRCTGYNKIVEAIMEASKGED